jgi:diguanylate cyclase (GGDEF)-like protein
MCDAFALDPHLIQHSVSKTCPIAGDYNTNVAIKNSDTAKTIFDEYSQLKKGIIKEYKNRFPYYNEKSAETIYFSSRAKALLQDENGNSTLLIGIIERETVSAELYKKARTDSLTNLYNRREFDSQINFIINLAIREKRYVSLIMCDIDHFKKYNDSLGHYAGDECITQIAHSISQVCSRSSDIVCRYGGEEFAVIIYGDDEETFSIAEKIREGVFKMKIPHPASSTPYVTISVGYYSVIPDSTSTPKQLIECADIALYKAKGNGRNLSVQYQNES